MKELTRVQFETLAYIGAYVRLNQCPPANYEIAEHFGLYHNTNPNGAKTGSNAVTARLRGLHRKGMIEFRHGSRGLSVTDRGWEALGVKPGHCPHCGNPKQQEQGAA